VPAGRGSVGYQPGDPAGVGGPGGDRRAARPGATSEDAARIAALERENRELRRANAILRSASAFFAAELDRP
jgi:transposase-like protein